MGSHFLKLHVCSADAVKKILGSRDRGILNQLQADGLKEHEKALRQLIDGNFPRGEESDNAGELMRATEHICKSLATYSKVVEMYEDCEETPVLWDFCFNGDGFELPASPDGVPVLSFHDAGNVEKFSTEFDAVKKQGGYKREFLSAESLEDILSTLSEAKSKNEGVFAFYEQ